MSFPPPGQGVKKLALALGLPTVGKGQDALAAAVIAALPPRTPVAQQFLDIPTVDNDPNVRHPDVEYVPGGWNGYAYWMGYTPYPGPSRENPSILASQDGQTWVKPTGAASIGLLTNAQILAMGYLYGSDTDLQFMPNGNLRILYRLVWENTGNTAENKEALFWQESSDGRTWTAPVKLIEVQTVGRTALLSPCQVIEADGSYSVWTVNANSTPIVERRTSTDAGLTLGAPTTCTFVGGVGFWHPHITRVGNRYYMLMQSGGQSMYWYESANGLAWTGTGVQCIPQNIDASGAYNNQYRSCAVPRPGGLWDVYVGVINSTTLASRFILIKNTPMPMISTEYLRASGGSYTATNGILTWGAAQIGIGMGLTVLTGLYAVGIGRNVQVTGNSSVAIGTDAKALSAESTVVGAGAVANNGFSVALGVRATITGTNGIAIGRDSASAGGIALGMATTVGGNAIAIGHSITATASADVVGVGQGVTLGGQYAVALGSTANAAGSAVAVGRASLATGASSTAVGTSADSSGAYSAAFGKNARAQGAQSSALGVDALANATNSTALGQASQATIGTSTAVGMTALATASAAVALGQATTASAADATALGQGATAAFVGSTALGKGAATTAANQIMLGRASETVYVPGTLTIAKIMKTIPVAKASLPSASTSGNGAIATITDPAAGKSRLVISNGTAWEYMDQSLV